MAALNLPNAVDQIPCLQNPSPSDRVFALLEILSNGLRYFLLIRHIERTEIYLDVPWLNWVFFISKLRFEMGLIFHADGSACLTRDNLDELYMLESARDNKVFDQTMGGERIPERYIRTEDLTCG